MPQIPYDETFGEDANIPGPFFTPGAADDEDEDEDEDILAIGWEEIINPQTGDEQSFIGLIASSLGLLFSGAALFIIIAAKRKKEESKEEVEA